MSEVKKAETPRDLVLEGLLEKAAQLDNKEDFLTLVAVAYLEGQKAGINSSHKVFNSAFDKHFRSGAV